MNAATCSAPLPRWPSSCSPRPLSLEERIRANPYLTATMTSESVILGVPLGSVLLVNYDAASSGERDSGLDAALVAGMPRCMYFGRLISRETKFGGVVFRMHCFNRGAIGVGAPRTFSTRTGQLHAVLLMQFPAPTPPREPCICGSTEAPTREGSHDDWERCPACGMC